jgi:hypothetical protein
MVKEAALPTLGLVPILKGKIPEQGSARKQIPGNLLVILAAEITRE